MPSFHSATFALLGHLPHPSPEASSDLTQAQHRLGFPLPASIREWYAHSDALEILAKHSNDDPPIPVSKFAVTMWRSLRLLPFRIENQGVCTWSIALDGSDDPPVYVDVDSNGRDWHLLAPNFSTYVRTCVWDYKVVLRRTALVEAKRAAVAGGRPRLGTDISRRIQDVWLARKHAISFRRRPLRHSDLVRRKSSGLVRGRAKRGGTRGMPTVDLEPRQHRTRLLWILPSRGESPASPEPSPHRPLAERVIPPAKLQSRYAQSASVAPAAGPVNQARICGPRVRTTESASISPMMNTAIPAVCGTVRFSFHGQNQRP